MKAEAKKIVPHLMYEWEMLCWTYGKLFSNDAQESECCELATSVRKVHWAGTARYGLNPLGAALLESFLLHARVMRDFLWKEKRHKDDALAADFFDDERSWKRPRLGGRLSADRIRLNKALAHLTYARTQPGESVDEWCIDQIKFELDKGWRAFLESLPEDRRCWFTSADDVS